MLHDLVVQYGPLIVFVNVLAASLGLPVPAMPTLIAFGAMASLHPGSIAPELLTVLVLAIFATLIGDSLWYLAGRVYGARMLNTLCRLSLSRDICVKKTERFFGRWGVRVLVVSRFVPGLSIVSVPMAGAMGTRYRTFLRYNGTGAVLWSGTGLLIGALFARQIEWLLAVASRMSGVALAVIAALLLTYAGYRWVRRQQLIRELMAARIDESELHALMQANDAPIVFDIRSPEHRMLDPFVIPGAQFADERHLETIINTYPRERKFVIYCACPNEVSAAWMAQQLTKAGFADVLPLRGGLDAWRDAGRPLDPLPSLDDAPETSDTLGTPDTPAAATTALPKTL
ncbi:DedA family protein/thiosulfate sulfurtransferase GlpE [Paraburkholderia bonniea]|uniref:DedA family protein/thiosulfate sulfurtransferase GlpE n=1 Tax=Paraburkholderia bonniea TaxID=2152891 RepID=UPI001291B557|nr:DedA family protein/thiosulfate sulfurtransferase GlpE [Paraburkholderia bonniea]WJF91804.1 DedA family protein/thiosulfate sulfurtransferase GlpE [Paraburkholderia bonniea]WJF95123.1 DedA family protein/thiosulfate sulfurtransferase GlpE [Paraburkholderia bonniea]